jgi:hypothetical protein
MLELNSHPEIVGKHAPFSPSQHYWIDYTPEKLIQYWDNKDAQQIGTEIHEDAATLITMHYKFLDRGYRPTPIEKMRGKDTVSLHVIHSIKNWLKPEVQVKYSDICFGTADALGFNCKTKTLYVNDLKTGKLQGDMRQLEQYAAIFYAEYLPKLQFERMIDISDCKVELRIFQYDDCILSEPPIDYIMNEVLPKARRQHDIIAEELSRRNR